jgi:hypothetical protein
MWADVTSFESTRTHSLQSLAVTSRLYLDTRHFRMWDGRRCVPSFRTLDAVPDVHLTGLLAQGARVTAAEIDCESVASYISRISIAFRKVVVYVEI